jgi:sterol 24-C-methyltransferase
MEAYLEGTNQQEKRTANYKQLVQTYYDAVTPYYQYGWGDSFHFAPLRQGVRIKDSLLAEQMYLMDQGHLKKDMTALDVGCGIGGPARNIARASGASIIGITISGSQVQRARRLTHKQKMDGLCRFEQGDAMDMRFENSAFDMVYMIESACHMPDKPLFYRECARVLKPGGIIAGWDWIQTQPLPKAARTRSIEPICQYFALPSLSSLEEIGEHLRGAGIEVQRLEDRASRSDIPWWRPLDRQLSGLLARTTAQFSPTLKMMHRSGELLLAAGKALLFSPLGFFVGRKPC